MRMILRRASVLALALVGVLLGGCETRVPQLSDLSLYKLDELKLGARGNDLRIYGPRAAEEEVASDPANSDYVTFLTELGKYESGGTTHINYAQPGNQAGYIGGWQFGEAALIDAGFYAGDRTPKVNDWKGRWTGLKGVSSKREFLASPAAQWHAIKTLMPQRWTALTNMGLDRFVGETVAGIEVTHSGLLAASHLGGPGGVRDFLRSGGRQDAADANDTRVSSYLVRFNRYGTPYPQKAMAVLVSENGG